MNECASHFRRRKDPAPRPDNPIIRALSCDRLGRRHYPLSATSIELPAHFFRVCSLSNLSQYRFSCCPSLLIPSARFGYFFPCLRLDGLNFSTKIFPSPPHPSFTTHFSAQFPSASPRSTVKMIIFKVSCSYDAAASLVATIEDAATPQFCFATLAEPRNHRTSLPALSSSPTPTTSRRSMASSTRPTAP